MTASGRSDLTDITATIVAETARAWLLDDGGPSPRWVPKSQAERNDDGTFTMPEWLAMNKGFL